MVPLVYWKPSTRTQIGLLANHTFAAHFLHLAVGIGDDPVTLSSWLGFRRHCGWSPCRRTRNGSGPAPTATLCTGLDIDFYVVLRITIHSGYLTGFGPTGASARAVENTL